jgi:hypothetical protein
VGDRTAPLNFWPTWSRRVDISPPRHALLETSTPAGACCFRLATWALAEPLVRAWSTVSVSTTWQTTLSTCTVRHGPSAFQRSACAHRHNDAAELQGPQTCGTLNDFCLTSCKSAQRVRALGQAASANKLLSRLDCLVLRLALGFNGQVKPYALQGLARVHGHAGKRQTLHTTM